MALGAGDFKRHGIRHVIPACGQRADGAAGENHNAFAQLVAILIARRARGDGGGCACDRLIHEPQHDIERMGAEVSECADAGAFRVGHPAPFAVEPPTERAAVAVALAIAGDLSEGSGLNLLAEKLVDGRAALEVAGLGSSILVLGTMITVLLTLAMGDASARPALSLFALKIGAGYSTRGALDVLNVFHLWTTAVLAVGLSKLAAVSFGEAAFWVFGYWVAFRLAILILI